jgi:hypothetical protein
MGGGCNPKLCARPGSGHRAVLPNLVRCCSAFAHTPTSPTSLDSRCSAIGPEPEAPDNGQAIDAGQAAAPIHRMHHSNEHPIGGAKIWHTEEPVCISCWHRPQRILSMHRHRKPHACWRHKLLASGRQRAHSVPPDHSQRKTRKIGPLQHYSPHAMWFPVGICAKANWQTGLLGLLQECAKWSLNRHRGY